MTRTPLGVVYSAIPTGRRFAHPFTCYLSGSKVTVSQGFILSEGVTREPTIGSTPISGNGGRVPTLKLDAGDTENSESWICVEVEPDAKGLITKSSRVEVVHRKVPVIQSSPTMGRHPLAMVIWKSGKPTRILAITMFNLRYHWKAASGTGYPEHFFL